MSKELPADDFPFLDRLLAEIKLLRDTKRPRLSSPLKLESKPSKAKRECATQASVLSRHARQTKGVATMATPLVGGQR